MSDQLDQRVESAPEAPALEVEEARESHADLGDRVSGVIKAAEELAEQIRADAREEAADIKRQAEEAATAHMRQVGQEGDELAAKAEAYASDIRRTGENYASEQRREAEAEAARMVEEGEGQARAMREAAEQMARRIETAALQRRDELGERSRVVEARLRRFQAGLVKISREVGELLEQPEEQPETLAEALEVDQRLPSA